MKKEAERNVKKSSKQMKMNSTTIRTCMNNINFFKKNYEFNVIIGKLTEKNTAFACYFA